MFNRLLTALIALLAFAMGPEAGANHPQKPFDELRLYNLAADPGEESDVSAEQPERVAEMMKIAEQTREKLGEYKERGSEQRPTGALFPEVPIISNHVTDWPKLSNEEKGRAKSEFKAGKKPKGKKR